MSFFLKTQIHLFNFSSYIKWFHFFILFIFLFVPIIQLLWTDQKLLPKLYLQEHIKYNLYLHLLQFLQQNYLNSSFLYHFPLITLFIGKYTQDNFSGGGKSLSLLVHKVTFSESFSFLFIFFNIFSALDKICCSVIFFVSSNFLEYKSFVTYKWNVLFMTWSILFVDKLSSKAVKYLLYYSDKSFQHTLKNWEVCCYFLQSCLILFDFLTIPMEKTSNSGQCLQGRQKCSEREAPIYWMSCQ